jgi:alkanesulfonate monooxygenase SsuD/methylene tetrahydromethanopterin reductase-like flavin-dependent oxidoreductase (luciferase family)
LIGGYSPAAISRLGRYGDGFISGGSDAATAQRLYHAVQEIWQQANRPGKPRFVGAFYYALGPDAATKGADYLRHYYRFLGPTAEMIAGHLAATPEAVKAQMRAFQDVGMGELIAWPCVAELDQVQRLADLVA